MLRIWWEQEGMYFSDLWDKRKGEYGGCLEGTVE